MLIISPKILEEGTSGPGISKKIKMIESERASERAGGPARKQEYVVVKKKKLLTYLIMGLYSS